MMRTPNVQEIQSWDRAKLERAFLESEKRLAEVVENAPVSIVLYDRHLRCVVANRHIRDRYWQGEDRVGKTPYEMWPGVVAQRLAGELRDVLVSQHATKVEDSLDLPDGTHTMLVHRFPLTDIAGETYGVAAVSVDITAQKTAEAAAQEALASAGRIHRAQAELVSQLGAPMSSIASHGEALTGAGLSAQDTGHVTAMIQDAARLRALVDELVELSEAEAMGSEEAPLASHV